MPGQVMGFAVIPNQFRSPQIALIHDGNCSFSSRAPEMLSGVGFALEQKTKPWLNKTVRVREVLFVRSLIQLMIYMVIQIFAAI